MTNGSIVAGGACKVKVVAAELMTNVHAWQLQDGEGHIR
jgi:hypothetical protein